MPTDDDLLFLRSAVERGVLDQATAGEVLAALEKVEALGASSSAREIAINRGAMTEEQAARLRPAAGAGTNGQSAPGRRQEAGGDPLATPGGGAAANEPPTPIRRRKRLGNFEIVAKLGVGGMGVVYKARQLSMDRLVALKVLPRRLAKDRSFIERFLREARSAARLNHPNIVQGIDVGEAEGLYYFAMELVSGETLKDRVRRVGRLPQTEALHIARQVALALEHASAHHITHRDVKPDNILLASNGVAKLADLGLAKRKSDAAVTQLGGPIGTPLYMSPEQARGKDDIDARSDIYSLGATLYHAVVGSPPFTGPNATSIITQHLFEKPPSPRAAVPGLTEGFCSVLARMMAKQPQQRYQSPAELLGDLNRLLQGRAPVRATRAASRGTSTALRRTRRRRRHSPIVPIFATTAIFVLAAGVWFLYTSLAGATEPPVAQRPMSRPRDAYVARPRAQPKPTPRPTRATPPKAPDKANDELARARQWAKTHADTPAEVIQRFRALARRYPNTPVSRAALAEARRAEEGLRAKADSALNEACHKAKRLAAELRFAEAVELLDTFGAEHRECLEQVSEERGFILSQALRTDRELRTEAGRLAKKGDYLGAIAVYKKIIGFGIPKLTARAKHEIAVLDDKHAKAQREALRHAEEAYLALRLRWAPMLQARQLPAVRAELATALKDPKMAPVKAAVEADAADLAVVASVWAGAERGARSLEPNEKFSVGGIRGSFVKYKDGVIHVRASGLLCKKLLRELTAAEVLALATRQMPADAPATRVALGLFYLAEGKLAAAERAFAGGQEAGGAAPRYSALVERRRADAVEAKAEALVARVAELRAARQWKEAAEALRTCEQKYGKTRSLARHRAQLDELALEIRLATLDVTDLFHGECRLAADGRRVEVTYDLRSPEQLADWDLRGADWELKDGRLALAGARATWRAPGDRDIQTTVELADAKGPPGEWGLSLTETPEARPLYALALPERAGLQATLRARRRDVVHGPASFRLNQPRKLAFGIRARRIAATLDGKDVLGWSDDGPKPPRLLYLGLGAEPGRTMHLTSIRVAALVDEQWVSDEIERLRVRLHKHHQLAAQPWRSLFNGTTVDPWRVEHGNWSVRTPRQAQGAVSPSNGKDGALITELGGNLVLDGADYEDFELRLKVQPLRANAVVRVSFRVSPKGERYGLTLGCRREDCAFVLDRQPRSQGGGELARFGERVALKPGQWYDLRIVAVGSEFRAELGGSLLCLVRDDRRHGGSLSLDVLHGGAALKEIACRHAGRQAASQP